MIDPFIGKTIGKYEIVEYIGRGATADVYKAYHPALERYVAIKLLHPFLSEDPEFLIRFQTEAKAAARLRHPNIVQVIDFDVIQSMYYLVMEFIGGITLKTQLQELRANQQRLDLNEAIRIARGVATGLAYAHLHGLIHRDIKPANIMLGGDGQVILTDFGTAKIVGGAQHTASGVTIGTAAYASPEQVLSQPSDPRSDLYSLGVVFFEMVAGQLPFQADTGVALFLKHITDPVPNPRLLNPALPPAIETLVYKAMAKQLEDRYQSADTFIEDLDRITKRDPITTLAHVETPPSELDRVTEAFGAALEKSKAAAPTQIPASPQPVPAPTGKFQLSPYSMSPSISVSHPAELPAASERDWNRAATHFARGYIAQWLRDGVARLRAEHQHALADDLEEIAARAEKLADKISPNDDLARNSALMEFLLSLGAPLPIQEIVPACLDFAPAGVEESGQAFQVTITNRGPGFLFGQIICQVRWLQVDQDRFGCFPGESVIRNIQPKLVGLDAGHYEMNGAVLIRSAVGEKHLTARIDILPPILSLAGTMIEFGDVGQGDLINLALPLTNRGKGLLMGTIRPLMDCLTLSLEKFTLTSGEQVTIALTADTQSIAPGTFVQRQALAIESNGGRTILGIQMRVYPPRLQIEPNRIDLGVIDITESEVKRSAPLKITNRGAGVLLGMFKPAENWLNVEPAAFRVAHGETQTVTVSVASLKTGDYVQSVQIVSNAINAILPVRLRVIFSLEPTVVNVPAGVFLRGSKPQGENGEGEEGFRLLRESPKRTDTIRQAEQPQTEIYLDEYWIGKYPVTNAEYAIFIKTTGRRPPEHWNGITPPAGFENHPVVNVTWNQARMYCVWLSEITGKAYQLPTEAQWEKAARGADGQIFPWGNRWDRYRCNTLESGIRSTSEVGAFSPAGDSPYNCADMIGNVWEWVLDWYARDYYARSSITQNPLGPATGAVKTIRGGAFSADRLQARAANRLYANGGNASMEIGFRVVLKK